MSSLKEYDPEAVAALEDIKKRLNLHIISYGRIANRKPEGQKVVKEKVQINPEHYGSWA